MKSFLLQVFGSLEALPGYANKNAVQSQHEATSQGHLISAWLEMTEA